MTTPRATTATPSTSRRVLTRIDHHLAQVSRRADGPRAVERALECPDHAGPRTGGPAGAGMAELRLISQLRQPLERMAAMVARRSGDRDEAEATVVAVAWELVRTRPEGSPPTPEALVDVIWTEVRRVTGLRRRGAPEFVALPEDLELVADAVVELPERSSDLLADAVSRGVLSAREAWIVGGTRILERPLTEVASDLGQSYEAVRQERRRAEARLRDFALAYLSSESA